MEMQDLTVLEAARALGYTKNAVKYQVGKLAEGEVYKDDSGILRITPAGIKALEARMGKKGDNQPTTGKEPANNHENHHTTTQEPPHNRPRTTKEPDNNHQATGQQPAKETAENRGDAQLYEALLRTVETLEAQLRIKDVQIESLTRLLDQQQHLQAAQIQALKAPAAEEPPAEAPQNEPVKEEPPADEPRGFFARFKKSKR